MSNSSRTLIDTSTYADQAALLEQLTYEAALSEQDRARIVEQAADLVRAIRLLIDTPPVRPASRAEIPAWDSLSPVAPYRVVNIGNSDKVRLLDFVEAIEAALGKTAIRNYMAMQKGDVPATWANAEALQQLTGYRPQTDFRDGIARFVAWFRDYYDK